MNRNTLIRTLTDAAVQELSTAELIRLGQQAARQSLSGLFENLSNDHLIQQANILVPESLGLGPNESAVATTSQEQNWNDTLEFAVVTRHPDVELM